MLTNSDCTVYSRKQTPSSDYDEWERQYVKKCWWYEKTKSDITTSGLKSADVLTVRIPDLAISVKKDDVIIKGKCEIEMQTVKDLTGIEYFRVTGANYNTFGRNPHIKVVGE